MGLLLFLLLLRLMFLLLLLLLLFLLLVTCVLLFLVLFFPSGDSSVTVTSLHSGWSPHVGGQRSPSSPVPSSDISEAVSS